MMTLGSVQVMSNPGSGSSMGDTLNSGLTVRVVFDGPGDGVSPVVGDVPLISSDDMDVVISEVQPGYAPFRQEVQVIKSCSLAALTTGNINFGATTISFSTTDMISDVEQAFRNAGYPVSINTPSNSVSPNSLFCSSGTLFVLFTQEKGDVPPMTSTDLDISQDPNDGALQGLWPVSGTFSLGIHGENTTELSIDASANDVSTAIAALYSVVTVTVTKDSFGLPLSNKSVDLYPAATEFMVNSVWTVSFTAQCTGNSLGIASGSCPASLGDEPLFFISSKNLDYNPSPYENQPVLLSR